MPVPLRVLVLEDRPADAELMLHALAKAGFAPLARRVETEKDFAAALEPGLDLVLADYHLPQFDGLRALALLERAELDIPFVLVSGAIGEELAVQAMMQGAFSYVMKDRLASLGQVAAKALADRDARRESRRAHEALAAEAEYRRTVEASMLAGLVAFEPDGRIRHVNGSFVRMVDLAETDLLGAAPPFAFWHPEEAGRLHAQLAEELRGERRPGTFETRFRRGDGTVIDVQIHSSPLVGRDGARVGWLSLVDDISQRKRAEEALREADRRKSEFLAMLSHELRNPLAAIRNSAFLLRNASGADDTVRQATGIVERQVSHLARMVDDLLEVTRIEHGKTRLSRERMDFVDAVRHTTEDLRSLLARRALALRLPVEPVWVDGDPTRLSQVVGNLLGNAAKFTQPAGHVEVTLSSEGGEAVLEVADDGEGFDPALKSHLFEPFAQADRSLDRSGGGLGLGLALVKGTVTLHGGTVDAHSDGPGLGARFTVRLPLWVRPDAGVPAQREAAPAAGCGVLVVEDNRDVADSLCRVLEAMGYRTAVAYDGPGAIAEARRRFPQIVLCDIGLPGMDGYAVARELRGDPCTSSAYLVAVTGYAQPEDRRRATSAGFDAHVAKPAGPDVLARVFAQAPVGRMGRAS